MNYLRSYSIIIIPCILLISLYLLMEFNLRIDTDTAVYIGEIQQEGNNELKPITSKPTISPKLNHNCDQKGSSVTSTIIQGRIPPNYKNDYEKTKQAWGFKDLDFSEEIIGEKTNKSDLSIVIASRNDGYGGNSTERLLRALQQYIYYPWNMKVEIVLVEWNFLNPTLFSVIQTLHAQSFQNVSLRSIMVPHDVAITPNSKGFDCNMFEYWAKNVGMRRSVGEWVLITNIDDIFPIKLLSLLDKIHDLDVNGFYTCQRHDIGMPKVPEDYKKLLPINRKCRIDKDDEYNCKIRRSNSDISYVGDFELFRREHLFKSGGFLEIAQNFGMDSEFLFRNLYVNKLTGYQILDCPYCHQGHSKHKGTFKEI